MNGDDFED
jgi:hypothetical protein